MRHCYSLALGALVLMGCRVSERPSGTADAKSSTPAAAVAELNRQIENFNAGRIPDLGITPIHQRVARVEYAPDRDVVNAFDADGTLLVALDRQPDGGFKGIRCQEFHTGMRQTSDGWGERWGEILAEFTLPGKMFPRAGAAN